MRLRSLVVGALVAGACNSGPPGGHGGPDFAMPMVKPVTFAPPATAKTAEDYCLAIADFNGDGKLDIVSSGQATNVLLGNGDGTFTTKTGFLGADTWIAPGDINKDGKLDYIAVGTIGVQNLLAYFGNGDGTFGQPQQFMDTSPIVVESGDFNGDGRADIAIANANGQVSIELAGTSAVAQEISTGNVGPAQSLAIGDLNGDGKLDLAIGTGDQTQGGLFVFFGRGDGHFDAGPGSSNPGEAVGGVAIGDFDGDAQPDLLAVGRYHGIAIVFRNTGGGMFANFSTIATQLAGGSDEMENVALADFNGDGTLDVAVLNGPSGANEYVNVVLNDGHADFTAPTTIGAIARPSAGADKHALGVGDFNRDGKPDVAVANVDDVVLLNTTP